MIKSCIVARMHVIEVNPALFSLFLFYMPTMERRTSKRRKGDLASGRKSGEWFHDMDALLQTAAKKKARKKGAEKLVSAPAPVDDNDDNQTEKKGELVMMTGLWRVTLRPLLKKLPMVR